MLSIPEDVYLEILIRLPVKSILISKCVCKSWCSLISEPTFVNSHLSFASKNNPRLIYQSPERNFYIESENSLSSKSTKEVECPLKDFDCHIDLLGSCNGLVCLRLGYNGGVLCVWNPATGEYKRIPRPPEIVPKPEGNVYAFGYDYDVDDYKLSIARESSVDVYTLKSASWKSIQSDDGGIVLHDSNNNGLVSNGLKHANAKEFKFPYVESLVSLNSGRYVEKRENIKRRNSNGSHRSVKKKKMPSQ